MAHRFLEDVYKRQHEYDGMRDPLAPSMYDAAGSLKHVSERNNYRFKPYHRLDLSVTDVYKRQG